MNSRERLRRCYYHEEVDRPGVFVRTGYPVDDPTYDRMRAFLEARSELKVSWSPAWPGHGDRIETHTEPHSEDFERRVTVLRTPAGDLRSTYLASLKGQPGMREQHFLATREDAEKYLSLPMLEARCDVSGFFEADRRVGDRGIADTSAGFNPAGAVAELFGSEAFAMATITDRDIVHELCRREMEIVIARTKFLLDHEVGPYFGMAGEEYLVPPLHGPTDFHEFNVTYDKPIIDLVHSARGRMHIHSHGSIKKVFDGFLAMGADVLHPFEAPPMGDITPSEAKKMARGRICLEGNIQIADMYESTPEEVRRQTEALIADAFDDRRGLIVCPTASPYLRGYGEECFERCKAMVDAVTQFTG